MPGSVASGTPFTTIYQTQQNIIIIIIIIIIIMFITVLGQHVLILLESSSGPSKIQNLT